MDNLVSKSRNSSIDIFRYLCSVMVVIIHTGPLAEVDVNVNYAVSQIMTRIGVPFFFAVAGYFYTQKLDKGQAAFIPYIKKIFITYFIWSCVYLLTEFISWGHSELKGFVVTGALNFLIRGSYYHFWFFPALIISTCIVTFFYKIKLKKLLIPFGIILYIVGCIGCSYHTLGMEIPILSTLYSHPDFIVVRRIFLMGLPFFICGHLINLVKDRCLKLSNKKLFSILLASVFIWLAEIVFVIKMRLQANIIITFGLFLLVIAVMIILLKNPLPQYDKLSEKCRIIANFTYYSHPLIMLIIKSINSDLPRIVFFLMTVVITAIVGLILSNFSKNKIVKCIVG